MGDIPQSRDTDHEDVSLALQVARSQLTKGDVAEAVKWLRKAADAAFDNDDDRRGIELSKAAGELQSGPPKPPPPKPSMPAPKPSIPAPRSVMPPGPPPGPKMAKPVLPTAAGSKGRSEAPPPPPPARQVAQPSSPTSKKPGGTRGRMPSQHKSRKVDEDEATREFSVKKHHAAPAPEPIADEWPTESVQPTDLHEIPPVPVPIAQAVRVAVSRAPNGTVVCRLLDETGVRAGEQDAMIVALTPESDLAGLFKA